MSTGFEKYLLDVTNASDCTEVLKIQSLWSGYGKISRYELQNSTFQTVVVKSIKLNELTNHPRGWNTATSHNRKVRSYEVETHWYTHWNHRCNDSCRVPHFVGSYSEGRNQWIILEDLNHLFPVRKIQVSVSEVKLCLKWLANFHALFLNHKPEGLWPIGTYWHLETRPDEFNQLQNLDLKAKAHKLDRMLNDCTFQTIVHGDAKLANFCFSGDGTSVAGVDFQYVGGGCGMKDVVYLIGSCFSSDECELYEHELLEFYFSELQKAVAAQSMEIEFAALEMEWRNLYPIAVTDFTRFMLGWMPTHQKVNNYHLKHMQSVLTKL